MIFQKKKKEYEAIAIEKKPSYAPLRGVQWCIDESFASSLGTMKQTIVGWYDSIERGAV